MNWVQYANQGATRNRPLSNDLLEALSFLPEMGLELEVFSGGQAPKGSGGPRTGSTRHDHGNAADIFLRKGGQRLDWANPEHQPIFQDFVRQAKANGVTGIGAGDGYMQPGSLHVGFGTPAIWGAGGKGENAAGWLREAYHGEPGHIHRPGDENQAIADSAMAALGKAPIGSGGGTTTAIGGSGADTMAAQEPGGLLGRFKPTEEKVGGLLGMMFPGMTPDRADSIRMGLAGMQGVNNQGAYNAAQGRMDARSGMAQQERRYDREDQLIDREAAARAAEQQQAMQEAARRRAAAIKYAESTGNMQLANALRSGLDVDYGLEQASEPTYRQVRGSELGLTGADADKIFNVGPDNKISGVGGGGTTVNVGNGSPELGKLSTDYGYVIDTTTGKPKIDPETGLPIAKPVPGSPAAREIAEQSEKEEERTRQASIKMGTTLENLALNIEELEDGGIPVTGVIGKVGSMIPGSQATDFSNRTKQITTRAALDEVQNMRDNSPTGGAVGQLTDSEREAIGLAATALSESSGKEEYLRAAKRFREVMLDTAFGQGTWRIDEKGQVVFGDEADDLSDDDLLRMYGGK